MRYPVFMTPSLSRPRKTVDDFMSLPEGTLAELIDGELLIMSPGPRELHQRVVGRLHLLLAPFAEARKLGRVYVAPMDVHLPSGDIVEPDLVYVSAARSDIIRDWIRGAPDLLVEVLSPSGIDRDRLIKRRLYARNGVPEYWIVDPQEAGVERLELEGPDYRPGGYFRGGATLTSPLLPGLEIPLAPLFAP
jgi:Uma2 family endonuclease